MPIRLSELTKPQGVRLSELTQTPAQSPDLQPVAQPESTSLGMLPASAPRPTAVPPTIDELAVQLPRLGKPALPQAKIGRILTNLGIGGAEMMLNTPQFALDVGSKVARAPFDPQAREELAAMPREIVEPAAKLAAALTVKGESPQADRFAEQTIEESKQHPEAVAMPILAALGIGKGVGKVAAKRLPLPETLTKQRSILPVKSTPPTAPKPVSKAPVIPEPTDIGTRGTQILKADIPIIEAIKQAPDNVLRNELMDLGFNAQHIAKMNRSQLEYSVSGGRIGGFTPETPTKPVSKPVEAPIVPRETAPKAEIPLAPKLKKKPEFKQTEFERQKIETPVKEPVAPKVLKEPKTKFSEADLMAITKKVIGDQPRFSAKRQKSAVPFSPKKKGVEPKVLTEAEFNKLSKAKPPKKADAKVAKEAKKYKTADEFVKSKKREYAGSHEAPNRSDNYAKPGHDLTEIYPDDIYSPKGARYYGDGSYYDQASINIISDMKGKPNKDIKIYRSVPKQMTNAEAIIELEGQKAQYRKRHRIPSRTKFTTLNKSDWYELTSNEIARLKEQKTEKPITKIKLNPGDWVSISKKYAAEHGAREFGAYKILSKTVKAKEIFTDGNSIHEWGYDPIKGGTKTKQQLTDIWNEANKPKPTVPFLPKKKPKPPQAPVLKPKIAEKPQKTAVKEVVKPIKKPVENVTELPKVIQLNKIGTDLVREVIGSKKLSEGEVISFKQTTADAISGGYVQKALDTAKEAIESKRMITKEEHIGMEMRIAELTNEIKKETTDIARLVEKGDKGGLKIAQGRKKILENDIDIITEGVRLGRAEVARVMSIGRTGINTETYDMVTINQKARATKGKRLTPKEQVAIDNIAKKYEAAEKKVFELESKNEAILAENERLLAEKVANIEIKKTKITSKAKKSKQQVLTNRAKIKKQIAQLGFRVNDITGVTPEAAHLIGKLAVSYIKEGAVTLDAVVKKVLVDLPDLKKNDVYRALNTKDPKAVKRIQKESIKRVINLKKQAKLLLDIEKAEKGIFEKSARKASDVPAEIKALQKHLRELRTQAYETVKKPDKLENAVRTINELQDQLDNYHRIIKKKRTPDSESLTSLKKKMSDLRRQLKVSDEIISLEEQLRTGDFKIPEKRKITPDSPELANAKIDLSLMRKKVNSQIEQLSPMTIGKAAREVVDFFRTTKATGDVSATGRQGFVLGTNTNPKVTAIIQAKALKAAKDPRYAEKIAMDIKNDPVYYLAEKSKLYLSEFETSIKSLKEEMFRSGLAEHIPVYGKMVKASNRHMVSYLNQLRFHNFKWYVEKFPNATHAELTAWADVTNVWSGRGKLGKFTQAANILSLGLFAPRFAASRVQTPYMAFRHIKVPRVRKHIAKDMTRTLAVGLSIMKMAEMLGGDVESDHRSPDWGKIKIGNTRIDIWGGLQQPMRLAFRLGSGMVTDKIGLTGKHLTEKQQEINPFDLISTFSMYKFSPAFTLPVELSRGKTIVGEPVEPSETAIRSLIPIVAEDFQDAYKDAGLSRSLWAGGLSFMGVSTSTYDKDKKNNRRKAPKLKPSKPRIPKK